MDPQEFQSAPCALAQQLSTRALAGQVKMSQYKGRTQGKKAPRQCLHMMPAACGVAPICSNVFLSQISRKITRIQSRRLDVDNNLSLGRLTEACGSNSFDIAAIPGEATASSARAVRCGGEVLRSHYDVVAVYSVPYLVMSC